MSKKVIIDFVRGNEGYSLQIVNKNLLNNATIDFYDGKLRFSYDKLYNLFTSLEYYDCKLKLRQLELLNDNEKEGD